MLFSEELSVFGMMVDLNLGKVGLSRQMQFLIFFRVFCVFFIQDEKYNYIDELEMKKVEKFVNEVMEWMNNVMNVQVKRSFD